MSVRCPRCGTELERLSDRHYAPTQPSDHDHDPTFRGPSRPLAAWLLPCEPPPVKVMRLSAAADRFTERIAELANELATISMRGRVTAIEVTEDAAYVLGFVPGQRTYVLTPTGPVEIRTEKKENKP